MRRFILAGTVAIALSVPAMAATVVVSGPASAAGVSCKKLTGSGECRKNPVRTGNQFDDGGRTDH
jgi:hypothetical protein